MDKIAKALEKLSPREREQVRDLLMKIKKNDFIGLDLKKLKGYDDIFRVRKGKLRIIYRRDGKAGIFVLKIERRNDTTYNF
ncbi:MAG: hypothetical protein AAB358_00260 [Patescibacteria group bacterium]